MGPLIEELIERGWSAPALLFLAAFLGFFAGYAAGRRQGKQEGRLEGARYAPLELRKETWEKGYCVICGRAAGETETGGEPGALGGREETGSGPDGVEGREPGLPDEKTDTSP